MDHDIALFPFHHSINYIVKEGDDWVVTREFRKLIRSNGHSRLFMRMYDNRGLCGIAVTPEHVIRIGENFIKQKSTALQTHHVGYQNFWKPLTYIDTHRHPRLPSILVLKNENPPEILLTILVEDFPRLAKFFADSLTLDFIKAFKQDDSI